MRAWNDKMYLTSLKTIDKPKTIKHKEDKTCGKKQHTLPSSSFVSGKLTLQIQNIKNLAYL